MKKLTIGQTVTYKKEYAFGKTGMETAKVVMINRGLALLTNGDQIPAYTMKGGK